MMSIMSFLSPTSTKKPCFPRKENDACGGAKVSKLHIQIDDLDDSRDCTSSLDFHNLYIYIFSLNEHHS